MIFSVPIDSYSHIIARGENMMNTCKLSNNTQLYLERYQEILNEMIRGMCSVVSGGSISGDFITQMIPHHRAAIAMSKNLLLYTTNIPLQNIAQNIISSQDKSIQSMTEVYPICANYRNSPRDLACYEQQNHFIMSDMFYEMNAACSTNSIDANFIREMIPHHRGAVLMSENALCFPICDKLVSQLKKIIASQKEGIIKMQAIGGTLLTGGMGSHAACRNAPTRRE